MTAEKETRQSANTNLNFQFAADVSGHDPNPRALGNPRGQYWAEGIAIQQNDLVLMRLEQQRKRLGEFAERLQLGLAIAARARGNDLGVHNSP